MSCKRVSMCTDFCFGDDSEESYNMLSVKCLLVYFCRFLVSRFECKSDAFLFFFSTSLQFGCQIFSKSEEFPSKNELPTRDLSACNYINIVYFWKIQPGVSGHFYSPPLINTLDAKCFRMKLFTYL